MKFETVKSIAETTGVFAVVGSLIFVGLQMRQTHEIALDRALSGRAPK